MGDSSRLEPTYHRRSRLKHRLAQARQNQESLRSLAELIIAEYCPNIEVQITLTRLSEHAILEGDGEQIEYIKWRVGDGIQTLFHEIGHYKLGHNRAAKYSTGDYAEYFCEVEAWLYSEHKCRMYGFAFDYDVAEDCLRFKLRRAKIPYIVRPVWRYRKEADDGQERVSSSDNG